MRIKPEHLRQWLAEDSKSEAGTGMGEELYMDTEPPDPYNWGEVVDITQTAFQEGHLAEEATWKVVVLISK